MTLINKMLSNQSWGEERKTQKGMHTVKETDMLAAKIELLMKRLEEWAQDKEVMKGTVQTLESHVTCEVCGNVGHLGNDCHETCEEASFNNNWFHQPQGNNRWNNQSRLQGNSNFSSNYNLNQPSLKDLVLGQAKINESLNKKLTTNDKILENINSPIKELAFAIKNQMSFNKMVETQLAQIATTIPVDSNGKIPAQSEKSLEKINVVTTKGGKSTRDPPNPNQSLGKAKERQEAKPSTTQKEKEK
jgi:predicted RNase H-like nuclease (RuvC/YqgF family)